MVLTIRSWELRRFVLHFFHFVFNVHDQEFPSIFTENYPDIDILGDTYLTDGMRMGVLDTIENHSRAVSRTGFESVADFCLKRVMNNFCEDNLYDFICIHAWNCLFGNLDDASLIDELEIVLNVFTDRINSEKFTSESWGKLSIAGLVAEKLAVMKRRDIESDLRNSSSFLDGYRRNSPPVEDEPVTKKPRADLQSESTCVEMSETELSEVELDRHGTLEETENETKSKTEDVLMQEDENEEFKGTEESEILKGPDEKSETKILERLKNNKKRYDKGKSKCIAEPKTIKEIDNETESKNSEESESVQESIFMREAEKLKKPEMIQKNGETETKRTEECKTAQEIGDKIDCKIEEKVVEEDCRIEPKIKKSEAMQKNEDKSNVEKFEESEKIKWTDDKEISAESEKEDTTTPEK